MPLSISWHRIPAFVLALSQICVATVLPAADALLDGEVVGTRSHVESPDSECATHHDELYCQLVRTLAAQHRPGAVKLAIVDMGRVERVAPSAPRDDAPVDRLIKGSSGPRAPPAV